MSSPSPAARPPLAGVRERLRALGVAAGRRRAAALRAALAVGTPLVVGAATGHTAEGGQAALGAFVVLYGDGMPYRRRAWLLTGIALVLALAMGLGSLVAASDAATVLAATLVGALSALLVVGLRVGPPREYFVVLVFLLGTTLPVDASAAPKRAGLVLAGGAIAWLIALAPALLRRPGPEHAAVRRATTAVARLLRSVGGPAAAAAGHDAVVAVHAAVDATDGSGSADAIRRAAALEPVLEAALALHVEDSPPLDRGWAALVRDAPDASAGAPGPHPPLPDRAAGPRLRDAVAALRASRAPGAAPAAGDDEPEPRRWRAPLRWSVGGGSPYRRVAVRMAVAVGGGLLLGHALGLDHPSWVAVSAAAVLQGSTFVLARSRALHRTVGTAIGVLLAGAIFALDPSTGVVIALIVALQATIELFVVAAYGFAVVFITPLVLLLIEVGGAGPAVRSLADVRLVDTIVGSALGALIAVLARPARGRGHLAAAQADAIRAAGDVLVPALTPGATRERLVAGRRRIQGALLRLRAAQGDAIGDAIRRDPRADVRWPVTATVERLAHLTLALPDEPGRLGPAGADPQAVRAVVDAFAARAEGAGGDAGLLGREVAPIPGLPRTTRTLEALRAELADLPA
ncbi:FUSC family protein [Patulibacter sp. SYSU D01012]|uniref:FUSC family protein n=1 Tax=Patulibacter sp. SYSU D01012 TaxID=2817381 RepID=UPI001B308483|nr:FUSC family protein [Patulibacter sp. SYSU D01012]